MLNDILRKGLVLGILLLLATTSIVSALNICPSINTSPINIRSWLDNNGIKPENYTSNQNAINDTNPRNIQDSDFSSPKVLAFYYGWYYDASEDWIGWNSPNPVGHTTIYLPLLGAYSSFNRSVVEQHIEWAQYAGVDGFISSWWHIDVYSASFGRDLEILLSVAEEKNFTVSVCLETEEEYPVAEQINYLIDKGYCDSPAWYYKENKPVFYVYSRITSRHDGIAKYWSYVRSQVTREIYLNLHAYNWASEGDALHYYIYFNTDTLNYLLSKVKNMNKGDYSLTVYPGFDNTASDIGGSTIISRDNGERYKNNWEAALNIGNLTSYPGYYADEILITSWNEWHESTSIEPAVDWGLEYLNITSFYAINKPPDKPMQPLGPASGKPGINYTFNTTTVDIQNEQVYFLWDWGDGNLSDWQGPYFSGSNISSIHAWDKIGSYSVRVKAKDIRGAESSWSDPLPITMPYSYNPMHQFFERLFERFPNAFSILRQLMG